MYALAKKMNTLYGKTIVCFYAKSFITSQFLHDPKGPIFVANVVVTNLTWEMVASNVISQPTNVATEFNTIAKIRKY